ncbi:MAG: hypothetical protein U1F11_15710 [Steroidobacteraceae bacterium]
MVGFQRVAPLRSDDLDRFWLLEQSLSRRHHAAGDVPARRRLRVGDATCRAGRPAAHLQRLTGPRGTHVYFTEIEQLSPDEARERADALGAALPAFLERFPEVWEQVASGLDRDARALERHDPRN